MKYVANCVAGLQDLAWQALQEDFGPLQSLSKEDGFLAFSGELLPRQLTAARYLNNAHLVLAHSQGAATIDLAARQLADSPGWHHPLRRSVSRDEQSFRLTFSDENRLVSADPRVVAKFCATIEKLTGLTHTARGGAVEFWILRRRSGKVFFSKRLTRRRRTEKDLQKGELRPELVHLLCRLSQPTPEDVFLDPFAGSGAIPFARTHYPGSIVFAFDRDQESVRRMKSLRTNRQFVKIRKSSSLIVHQADARSMERIEDGFIHKVVTDPPWGLFDRSLETPAPFYEEVIRELCRVTRSGGSLILLLGDRDLPSILSGRFDRFLHLQEQHPLLVAGKKAVVCKWRRR